MRWTPDNSVELHVTGNADEVETVARHLAGQLASPAAIIQHVQTPPDERKPWGRVGKLWAFTIGLATIVGGVAAVLALIH